LKLKLSGFDSLDSGDGLKIYEHRRVAGKERSKTLMVWVLRWPESKIGFGEFWSDFFCKNSERNPFYL
jgi:hypothetical protein